MTINFLGFFKRLTKRKGEGNSATYIKKHVGDIQITIKSDKVKLSELEVKKIVEIVCEEIKILDPYLDQIIELRVSTEVNIEKICTTHVYVAKDGKGKKKWFIEVSDKPVWFVH